MRILVSSLVILIVSAALVKPVYAQCSGCPWCVTPTQCCGVPEDTPISACYYTQGEGCGTIPGSCTYDPDFGDLAAVLQLRGFQMVALELVPTGGVDRTYAVGADGTMLAWDCGGSVRSVIKRDDENRWIVLDPADFADRFAITAVMPWLNSREPARRPVGPITVARLFLQ
jgi:hypothetical protein